MANSDQLYNQMQNIIKQAQAYTPVNASDVTKDFTSHVGNFQPQYQELADTQQRAYAAPAQLMQGYYNQYGTGGAGPSAMSMLNTILNNVGQGYGRADVISNSIDAQKSRLNDLAQSALGQYNSGRDALMQQYQMQMPLYQAALQKEAAAKARAAQLNAARMSVGGYGQPVGYNTQPQPQQGMVTINTNEENRRPNNLLKDIGDFFSFQPGRSGAIDMVMGTPIIGDIGRALNPARPLGGAR